MKNDAQILVCDFCHKPKSKKQVSRQRLTGLLKCRYCRQKDGKKESCSLCSKNRLVHVRTDEGPICRCCYGKVGNRQRCYRCGEIRQVVKRTKGGKPVCDRCYSSPRYECYRCGRKRPVAQWVTSDEAFCHECYIAPLHTCCRCGQSLPVAQWLEGGPLCLRCYAARRSAINR